MAAVVGPDQRAPLVGALRLVHGRPRGRCRRPPSPSGASATVPTLTRPCFSTSASSARIASTSSALASRSMSPIGASVIRVALSAAQPSTRSSGTGPVNERSVYPAWWAAASAASSSSRSRRRRAARAAAVRRPAPARSRGAGPRPSSAEPAPSAPSVVGPVHLADQPVASAGAGLLLDVGQHRGGVPVAAVGRGAADQHVDQVECCRPSSPASSRWRPRGRPTPARPADAGRCAGPGPPSRPGPRRAATRGELALRAVPARPRRTPRRTASNDAGSDGSTLDDLQRAHRVRATRPSSHTGSSVS